MLTIIKDCAFVARVQMGKAVLQKFFKGEGHVVRGLKEIHYSTVSYVHGIRVKRVGQGWYEFTGYREDGADLRRVISDLEKMEREMSRKAESASRKSLLEIQRSLFDTATQT